LEDTLTGLFGKPGSYAALRNEAAFRYNIADGLRFSLGGLVDQHAIQNVPGLADRTAFDFSGITGEVRWQALRRETAPVGLAFSFAPQWQRIDLLSGQPANTYALPLTLLADAEPIARTLFVAFNFTIAPSFGDGGGQQAPMGASAAGAFALAPGLFVGGEVRHLNHNQQGFLTGHALFVGPSLYLKLSETLTAKAAWSIQIPDETTGTLDLTTYERHQALFQLVKGF
jgi:hypothetical protein